MKTPKNPLHAVVQPLGGEQLPSDWKQQASEFGGTFDRREMSQIVPQWTAKQAGENIVQAARLSKPTWEQMFGKK